MTNRVDSVDVGPDSTSVAPEAMSNGPLRFLLVAWAASWIEDWLMPLAIGVYAFEVGGASAAGLAGVVRMLPAAIGAPVLGLLVDRWPRQRVLALAFGVQAAACAAMAVTYWLGAPFGVLLALLAVEGFVSVLIQPATSAIVPWIARTPIELTAANTSLSVWRAVGIFVGPLLGAAVLGTANAGAAFAIGGAFMFVSFVASFGVHVPRSLPASGPKRSWVAEMAAGFKALASDKSAAWIAVLLSSVQGVLRGAFSVLSVVVAVDLLGASRASAGYLQAAAGLGGVLAGLVLARRFERGSLAVAFTIGVVLRTAPFALIAVVPSLAAAVIFMAINGVGNTAMTTGGLSLLQRLMPNHVTGRALSAVGMVTTLGVAAGAALVAPLLTITNARTLLIIIGVAWPVAALSGWSIARQGDGRATAYDADIAVLGSVPFLAVLPLVALETAARNLHRAAVATGEKVIVQGTHGDRFFVLVSGTAAAEVDGQVVDTIPEGGWFGELALLHDTHRAATVRMATDGEVAYLKRSDFLEALAVDASAIDMATTGWERESTTAMDVPEDQSIAELLSQIPLMARASRREVDGLVADATELELGAREVIYEEGDDPDAFYLVLSGSVEVVTGGSVVADIGRGGWFGELALLHNEPRRASVRTQAHAALLRIDAASFLRVADADEAP